MSDLVDDKVVPAVVKEEIHSPNSDGKLFPSVVEEVCILDSFTSELVDGKEVSPVVKVEVHTPDSDGKLFPHAVEEVCTADTFPSELVDGKEFIPVVKEEVHILDAFTPELVHRKEFPPIVEEICTPDALPSELVGGKEFLPVAKEVCCTPNASTELVDAQEFPPVVKKEPCSTFHLDEENSQPPPELWTDAAEIDDIDYYTISGTRPYFSLVLGKSHVNSPFQVFLPAKITPVLPSAKVPVVLTFHGKRWHTCYRGDYVGKKFGSSWKSFVVDNDLKVGDCCFFELMECNTAGLEFKVIIIRSQPIDGDTPQTAIVIE